MEEIEITEKQLRQIEEFAHREYVTNSVNPKIPDLYVCKCYVKAIITFITSNDYSIIEGKIVKNENTKAKNK